MAADDYTASQREEALALYEEHGPAEASRRTGIPKGTISSWASRAGRATKALANTAAANEARTLMLERRRQDLAADLLDDAHRLRAQLWAEAEAHYFDRDGAFHRAKIDKPTFADQRVIVDAVGKAVDKVQLLTGQATERTESFALDAVDREIARLTAEMNTEGR